MRAVVQRVSHSRVLVDEQCVGEIQAGFLVLLGVQQGDASADLHYLADKVANLRIMEDEAGKMNRSLSDVGGAMLVISQFTLLGDCRRGRRPSFMDAEDPARAADMFTQFCALVRGR